MMTTGWTTKLLVAVALTATVALYPTVTERVTSWKSDTSRRLMQVFDPATVVLKERQGIRRLEFVHITKNGGSAIETAAARHGIIWGACHYKDWKNLGCDAPDWPTFDMMKPPEEDKRYHGEPWHAPHYWLSPPVYGDASTFAVIRNPYDRIVSEYHYFAGAIFHTSKSPKEMNDWITDKINEYKARTFYGSHLIPQHFFVFDQAGRLRLTHVIRYENLNEEFADLMKVYKLPVQLPEKHRHFRDKSSTYFTKEDLADETIALINEFYQKDFELLGYPMVTTGSDFQKISAKD